MIKSWFYMCGLGPQFDQWDKHGADYIRATLGENIDNTVNTTSYKPGTLVPESTMPLGKDAKGKDVHIVLGKAYKTPKKTLDQISVSDLQKFQIIYDRDTINEEREDAIDELKGLEAADEGQTLYAEMLRDLIDLYNKRDSDTNFIETVLRERRLAAKDEVSNAQEEQASSKAA